MKKRISALLVSSALGFSLISGIFAGASDLPEYTVTGIGAGSTVTITGINMPAGDHNYVIYRTENGVETMERIGTITVGEDGRVSATLDLNKDINGDSIAVVITGTDGSFADTEVRITKPDDPDESKPDDTTPEDSDPETSDPETSDPETSNPETSEPETSEPETSEPESRPETSRPVNPDTPSGGSTSDDDDDDSSGGGGGGGGSSTPIKNPNPIKYKGKTEQQTPTQITTPNTGWTSDTGSLMVFFDVQTTDWFANAVNYVTQHGMMVGSNNRFSPNDRLTRAMMAQILYNMEGMPAVAAASFPDVNSTDWYANAVGWASASGCMTGYANGRFGPNDPITREQLAAILYRYSGTKGYTTAATAELSGFADGNATSGWAQTSMRWAVTTGLLSGKTGNRLDPTGTATRAEVAQILMNFGTKIAQ